MRRSVVNRSVVSLALVAGLLVPWARADSPPRVYLLGEQALTAVDATSLDVVATVPIPIRPNNWWFTGDGARLAVVSQAGIFRFKEPAVLTVIDLERLEVAGSETLDYHAKLLVRTDDGLAGFVFCAGRRAKGKRPAAPPSLIRVDVATAGVAVRRRLTRVPQALELGADDRVVVLAYPGTVSRTASERHPGRLELYDPATLEERATVELPGPVGDLFWNGDRSLLYVLDPGIDRKQAERSLPGRVYVIDPLEARVVADIEVGVAPGPLSWDPDAGVFYLLTRPRKSRTAAASMQVIRGEELVSELALPHMPLAVVPAPDRSRFYVLEGAGITVVDGAAASIVGRIALPRPAGELLFLDPPTRAFVLHPGSSVVTAVDLEARKVLGDVTTGRTGVKIGKLLLAATATALSQVQSQMITGNPYVMAQVYTVPPPQTNALVAPDGRTAFVYNSQTNDVTIIDTEAYASVEKVGGGIGGLELVADGALLAAPKMRGLVLVDASERTVYPEIPLNGWIRISPDGAQAWSVGTPKQGAIIVDLAQRRVVKRIPGVSGQVLFWPPEPPPAEVAAAPEAELEGEEIESEPPTGEAETPTTLEAGEGEIAPEAPPVPPGATPPEAGVAPAPPAPPAAEVTPLPQEAPEAVPEQAPPAVPEESAEPTPPAPEPPPDATPAPAPRS